MAGNRRVNKYMYIYIYMYIYREKRKGNETCRGKWGYRRVVTKTRQTKNSGRRRLNLHAAQLLQGSAEQAKASARLAHVREARSTAASLLVWMLGAREFCWFKAASLKGWLTRSPTVWVSKEGFQNLPLTTRVSNPKPPRKRFVVPSFFSDTSASLETNRLLAHS